MSKNLATRSILILKNEGINEFTNRAIRFLLRHSVLDRLPDQFERLSRTDLIEYSKNEGKVLYDDPDLAQLRHHNSIEYVPSDVEERIDFSTRITCQIPYANVVGARGVSITKDGRVIYESVKNIDSYYKQAIKNNPYYFISNLLWEKIGVDNDLAIMTGSDQQYELGFNMIMHTSRYHHYGHWLGEYLPKLYHLYMYENITGKKPQVIIGNDPPKWMTQSLDLLGYGSERRIEWDDSSASINRLVVPLSTSTGDDNFNYSPIELQWVRDKLLDSVELEDTCNTRRIFVSRQGLSRTRKTSNFEEIRTVLDEHNFEIIKPEKLSFHEQIQTFSNADLVVGVFGSGLGNILFSKKTHLIEILNSKYLPYNSAKALSIALGHSYTGINVESSERFERGTSEKNKPLIVSSEMLDEVITRNL
jgi:hypothetical protein